MKYLYYIGDKVAYLFSTEDNIHLKTDIIIDKNMLQDGINLMKKAYADEHIIYEPIIDKLNINDNLFTLADFQEIVNTPDIKNYDKYSKTISIDLYNFLKNVGKENQ